MIWVALKALLVCGGLVTVWWLVGYIYGLKEEIAERQERRREDGDTYVALLDRHTDALDEIKRLEEQAADHLKTRERAQMEIERLEKSVKSRASDYVDLLDRYTDADVEITR